MPGNGSSSSQPTCWSISAPCLPSLPPCTRGSNRTAGLSSRSRSCSPTMMVPSMATATGRWSEWGATHTACLTSPMRSVDPASKSGRWSDRPFAMKPMHPSPGSLPCWSARSMDADGALELLRAGDPAGALALLGDQLSPDVIDPALLVARGMVQLANNHPAEALTALQMAVALGETAPPALLNLALAQEKTGDVVHALQLMETLERHLPDWDEPPLRLAEALRAAGKLHDAELAYGRVLNINPGG